MHLTPYSINKPSYLKVFNNVVCASDPNNKIITTGTTFYFGASIISWWSKKQPAVFRSNTEVEYISLTHATVDLPWVHILLRELLCFVMHFNI